MEKVRIDKWLWAVRIFKTRSLAAEACTKGKVFIDDTAVKASRIIKPDEKIAVRKGPFTAQFKVLQLSEKRMSAALAVDFCKDITPEEEIERMKLHALAFRASRNHGEGRPTKRERRALDDFLEW